MSQESNTQLCSICNDSYLKSHERLGDRYFRYECERCGSYKIGDVDAAYFKTGNFDEYRHLVSAWIRRENKIGNVPQIGGNSNRGLKDWLEELRHLGFPEATNEKLDALLLGYAEIIKGDYKRQISYGLPHLVAEIAARNVEQVNGLTDFLKELGYIDEHPRITANGWRHIDELRKTAIAGNSAFIAMWFDDSTKKYRDVAIAAIEYCGYKAMVVDQQEYNDFIMNQVISLIRQSRFLVADFTSRPETMEDKKLRQGVRGGVYWEAGMAYGLGRPVIHTCEDSADSRNRIHFDVDQYNTIFWNEDELGTEIRSLDQTRVNPNFAEKLAARILATVGKGNYQGDGK